MKLSTALLLLVMCTGITASTVKTEDESEEVKPGKETKRIKSKDIISAESIRQEPQAQFVYNPYGINDYKLGNLFGQPEPGLGGRRLHQRPPFEPFYFYTREEDEDLDDDNYGGPVEPFSFNEERINLEHFERKKKTGDAEFADLERGDYLDPSNVDRHSFLVVAGGLFPDNEIFPNVPQLKYGTKAEREFEKLRERFHATLQRYPPYYLDDPYQDYLDEYTPPERNNVIQEDARPTLPPYTEPPPRTKRPPIKKKRKPSPPKKKTKKDRKLKNKPRTYAPRTYEPRTYEPRTYEPRTYEPRTYAPRTQEPRTYAPRTQEPRTYAPRTYEPRTRAPTTKQRPKPTTKPRPKPTPTKAPTKAPRLTKAPQPAKARTYSGNIIDDYGIFGRRLDFKAPEITPGDRIDQQYYGRAEPRQRKTPRQKKTTKATRAPKPPPTTTRKTQRRRRPTKRPAPAPRPEPQKPPTQHNVDKGVARVYHYSTFGKSGNMRGFAYTIVV